jgi:hypothetical protein
VAIWGWVPIHYTATRLGDLQFEFWLNVAAVFLLRVTRTCYHQCALFFLCYYYTAHATHRYDTTTTTCRVAQHVPAGHPGRGRRLGTL